MLSLIQTQVVTIHEWIDENTFTDIVAISQMTPGPIGINSATYIGYTVLEESGASQMICILGSFIASIAVVLPSFLIVLAICRLYSKFSDNFFSLTSAQTKRVICEKNGKTAKELADQLIIRCVNEVC